MATLILQIYDQVEKRSFKREGVERRACLLNMSIFGRKDLVLENLFS